MKTTPQPTSGGDPATTPGATLIDTSKMSAGQRAALEMAEAARDERRNAGFAASLLMGRPDFEQIIPFPRQSIEDSDQGDAFIARLRRLLDEHADPDAIDREGEIPDELLRQLAELGAFGIKVPMKYGGLGLSQTNYSRAAMLLGGLCGNLTALLSAHQSIGAPQPLILFGTEEQKQRYLPRCARGEISAFALTEGDVGSDPARMTTNATLSQDGSHYVLNGEKLWCTNGTKAGIIVVMAKTPTAAKPHSTTAFIVETSWPGVEVLHRCRFMGLRALYNGVIRFKDVRVPKENVLGGEGKGLKVALTTLNTGRITLPAACVGLSRRCLDISTRWARKREQWGQAIGRHAAISDKLARMAADTLAMEALVHYVSSLVDRDKNADVRLEAAIGKMWGTERAWRIVDDTMQIRGGRGYETADSLRERGEVAEPVERLMRDSRINTIFEGSSEIMRLFIAREALDPHLKLGAQVIDSRLPWGVRIRAAFRAAKFYTWWYPTRWLPSSVTADLSHVHPMFHHDLGSINRLSRKLARRLFHVMLIYGPSLEKRQLVLGRFVDIAAELLVWSCLIGYVNNRVTEATYGAADIDRMIKTVHYFGNLSRARVGDLFRHVHDRTDGEGYQLACDMLKA